MIIRQLKQNQYEHLHKYLRQNAHAASLDASYTVGIIINGTEYEMKVQPERHNKMAVLQALRVDRNEKRPDFELITQGNLLSSLFEIFIDQEIGR